MIGIPLLFFFTTQLTAEPINQPPAAIYNDSLTKLGETAYKTPQGEPLWIKSSARDRESEAHAYTIIAQPYIAIEAQLQKPVQWCEILILHSHIKGCVYSTTQPGHTQLELYFGDKTYQELTDAETAIFAYKLEHHPDHTLKLQLSASEGPMGSFDLSLSIEITELDPQHSFVHITYVTHQGTMAQLMLNAYLSSLGRNKVGFSPALAGPNTASGKIKGTRGVIERNVVRYLLALLAYLDTSGNSPQQHFINSAENWQRYSQQYTEQLKELNQAVYLKGKLQEHDNQLQRQREIDKTNPHLN